MTRRVKYSIGNQEFESISKCSEYFGVAPNTIKNWIERGINGLSYLSHIDGIKHNVESMIQPLKVDDIKVPTASQSSSKYIDWTEHKTYHDIGVESKVKSDDELLNKVLRKLEEVKSVNNILMGMIDELVLIIKKI